MITFHEAETFGMVRGVWLGRSGAYKFMIVQDADESYSASWRLMPDGRTNFIAGRFPSLGDAKLKCEGVLSMLQITSMTPTAPDTWAGKH